MAFEETKIRDTTFNPTTSGTTISLSDDAFALTTAINKLTDTIKIIMGKLK